IAEAKPKDATEIKLDCNRSYFCESDARLLGNRLVHLLNLVTSDPDRVLTVSDVLPAEERALLLTGFNPPKADYPKDSLIHALFEAQAAKRPDAVALVYEDHELSYAQLNARANQLAHHLRKTGVGPDQLVVLCVERSLEMIVGILGILKAGGAYVPLDPHYPQGRLAHMLQDAAPRVVVTQSSLRERFSEFGGAVVALDDDRKAIDQQSPENLDRATTGVEPSHLAYVIYTSGSTGVPKGVMVEHANVHRLFSATEAWFRFDEEDVWSLFHSCAFDFSVWEIWGALFHGGRLVVVPHRTTRDPEAFYRLLCEEGVTILNQTPSSFRQLIAAQRKSRQAHSLKYVVFGGEALDVGMLDAWYERNAETHPRLVNMSGITDTTVHVTWQPIAPDDAASVFSSRAIGVPIPDLRVYILDSECRPVPIGVAGEMYVGGAGVARGYLNGPELTAERFIADPFSGEVDARLYKTGDLGRWRADGTLDYLGRNDHQVKIRGYRIELGEIEAQLGRHPDVQAAVVVAREDTGEKRLVAYVTARDGAKPDPDALRQVLMQQLPEYMMPGAFVVLDALPQTSSGKLDRGALPAPDNASVALQEYEAPRTETEMILAEVWQALLGIERVGRRDHFFVLGGHSMLAVRLVELLGSRGLKAEARTIFTTPLLHDYAATLVPFPAGSPDVPANGIPPGTELILPDMLPLANLTPQEIATITAAVPGGAGNVQDIYPLLPLQEGMLFHHLMQAEQDAYVTRAVLEFDREHRLDDFLAALNRVIARHDALRTVVLWEGLSHPVQVVLRQATLVATAVDSAEAQKALLLVRNGLQRPRLDVRHAPLMAARVVQDDASGKWLLELSAHHMIIDHETLALIMAEVQISMSGKEARLPASVPFRNIVAQARNTPLESHASYFREALADIDEPTAPFGILQVSGSTNTAARCRISPASSGRIRHCARTLGVSPSTLFHAAWALVLARCTARTDVVFGTVLSGRLQGGADTARAIGLLINSLPLRIPLAQRSVEDVVRDCHERLASLLVHVQAPLSLALQCSDVPSPLPLFTTLLNYRHSALQAQGESLPLTAAGVRVLHTEESTNYPISLQVDEYGTEFMLSAYCIEGLDADRINGYLLAAIETVTSALEEGSHEPALSLDILPFAERRRVLFDFNQVTSDYMRTVLVHELFEAQVRVRPDSVAVVHRGETLDYATLNARANQLAHYLRAHGIKPDDRVAVCLERGVEMVVSLLGILKAGGAYVPLDPGYPQDRIRHMLSDSAPVALLTQRSLTERVGTQALPTLVLDAPLDREALASQPTHDPVKPADLDDARLAYVIYTSGSTGEPKGAMVEHHSVVRLVTTRDYVQFDGNTIMAQASNTSFDAATFEIWGALLNGGRLVVVEKDTLVDAERLAAQIHEDGINVLFVTAALFNHHAQSKPDCFAALGTLVFGGDVVSPTAVASVVGHGMPERLLNGYGPTETTTFCAWRPVTAERLADTHTIPIGRGFADTRLYVLTPDLQPVPVGVPGELFVAGSGVARGYLNRDALSAERFLQDPFAHEFDASDASARMYRTGDLVRWLPDGSLEFLGRRDSQIKLRGFRIELGEIESRLVSHPDVREALVLLREDVPGDRRLVAYLVCHDAASFSAAQVRAHLASQLPDYMLPSAFVVLDAFPLTPNGKLDRKALPMPEGESLAAEYEP
ncbi:MAG: amino acid adenylation domain-containing protein, partial [Lysobacteraceae bacterium]